MKTFHIKVTAGGYLYCTAAGRYIRFGPKERAWSFCDRCSKAHLLWLKQVDAEAVLKDSDASVCANGCGLVLAGA